MDCPKCGASGLAAGVVLCEYCGASLASNPVSAPAPVQAIPQVQAVAQPQNVPTLSQIDASGIKPEYLDTFREIEANGGKMTPKWNWWAFIFTAFWYFYKGMWAKGLIILCIEMFSGGVAIPLAWVYCGVLGNYDYYLLKVRQNQFW